MAISNIYSRPVASTYAISNQSMRQRFNGLPSGINFVRFRFQAGTTSVTFNNLHIGDHDGVNAFGMVSLTSLKFSGANSITIPAGTSVWTDWLPFTLSGQSILTSFVTSTSGTNNIARGTLGAGSTNGRDFGSNYNLNGSGFDSYGHSFVLDIEGSDTEPSLEPPDTVFSRVYSASIAMPYSIDVSPLIYKAMVTVPARVGKYIGPQIGIELPCQQFCFSYYTYSKMEI